MEQLYSNFSKTTLTSSISDSDTTIGVVSTDSFPTISGSDYFLVTLDDGTNTEICKCTFKTLTSLTVTRGFEDTTASSFAMGSRVQVRLTAASLNGFASKTVLNQEVSDIQDALALKALRSGDTIDNVMIVMGETNTTPALSDDSNKLVNTQFLKAKLDDLGLLEFFSNGVDKGMLPLLGGLKINWARNIALINNTPLVFDFYSAFTSECFVVVASNDSGNLYMGAWTSTGVTLVSGADSIASYIAIGM